MTMLRTAPSVGMIIGSGLPKNPGRIAGGAQPIVPNPTSDTFGKRVMTHVATPNAPGGLIDKIQQKNPSATADFNHPFDGGTYRGVSTQPLKTATTMVNNIPVANPYKTVNKTVTTDRGTFFGKKVGIPLVKTQFGTNRTGMKTDTPFHPNPVPKKPPTGGPPEIETAKVQNTQKPPSFPTTGNHWQDPHNSFIKGAVTAANPQAPGKGRWNTVKRSAV